VRSAIRSLRSSKEQHPGWNYFARFCWAVLFLVHIVPFLTVSSRLLGTPSTKLVLSFIVIVGIMTLALLKAIDIEALRFQLNRQKWFTVVVIGLLFHGDVVAKQLPDIMVAESTMALLVTLVCASRKLHHRLIKLIAHVSLNVRLLLHRCIETCLHLPVVPVYALLSSPRPPPVI
jgi:hypothetical protein